MAQQLQLAKYVEKRTKDITTAARKTAASRAYKIAPVVTGRYRAGIETTYIRDGFRIIATVPYSYKVEWTYNHHTLRKAVLFAIKAYQKQMKN